MDVFDGLSDWDLALMLSEQEALLDTHKRQCVIAGSQAVSSAAPSTTTVHEMVTQADTGLDGDLQQALALSMADVARVNKQDGLEDDLQQAASSTAPSTTIAQEIMTPADIDLFIAQDEFERDLQQAFALSTADIARGSKQDELEEHLKQALALSAADAAKGKRQNELDEANLQHALAQSAIAERWRQRRAQVGIAPSSVESAFEKTLKKITWTKDNLDMLEQLRNNRSVIEQAIADDKSLAKSDSPQLARDDVIGRVWTMGDIPRLQLMRRNICLDRPDVPPANANDWDGIQGLPHLEARAREFSPESTCNWRTVIDQLMNQCGCSNDRERARAIFVWEACHLTWTADCIDRDNKPNDPTSCETLLDDIVRTRCCVCVGFAALFAAACRHVGLQAEYISGWTKLTKRAMDQDGEGLCGHVWNAVQLPIEGGRRWFMVDCGWSKRGADNFNDTFWAVPPEWLIPLFFPRVEAHQHMEGVEGGPWSRQKFLDMPAFFPAFHMLQQLPNVQLQLNSGLVNFNHFLVTGLNRQQHEHITFQARSNIRSVQVEMVCASTFSNIAMDEDTQELQTAFAQESVFRATPQIGLERDIHLFRVTIDLSTTPVEKPCVKLIVWARRERIVDGIEAMQTETVQLMHMLAELQT